MYLSWIQDQEEELLSTRNNACLIGSFWNPKAAKEILGINDNEQISVSDEEFDLAMEYVAKSNQPSKQKKKKKKRLTLKKE